MDMRRLPPLRSTLPLRPLAAASLLVLLSVAILAAGAAGASRHRPAPAHGSRYHGPSYMTGIGDEADQMFAKKTFLNLHTRIARYITPYNTAVKPRSLKWAREWIADAEADHMKILIAFYHSEHPPMNLPSAATYRRDVAKFIKDFPHVREYQAWDEDNRGFVYDGNASFPSPSAVQTALYYQALKRDCTHCTVIGLDVLDQDNPYPTLQYIAEFKYEVRRIGAPMPSIWGLHNYSDINRFQSWRTREIVRAMGGQVWLTETGGIVKFAGEFKNNHGAGVRRAAKVLKYMFGVASAVPQIKRLYIYDWHGGNSRTRFDAGLMNAHEKPRQGYDVVCRVLHGTDCNLRTVDS
ncbi:MAG TPA: hypothetical protein VMU32_08675 [Solirubrobacteraceae bacterium]|nr:hypothetical protein [Solirubrobacteraceae bacterium]